MGNHKKGAPHHSEIAKLKRIEGQVRGVINMIEEERYCVDILTQLKAIKSAIGTVERNIVDDHLNHCVHSAISSSTKKQTDSVLAEIKLLLKTTK
ncbi:MAG: metal-sensitive transcriptional regulator [Bdellovibrionales bacterium]|nr:metal-sensitive transcriptional regulator [Bdellovibrionales bacterium]